MREIRFSCQTVIKHKNKERKAQEHISQIQTVSTTCKTSGGRPVLKGTRLLQRGSQAISSVRSAHVRNIHFLEII